jgi:hypothetical protein
MRRVLFIPNVRVLVRNHNPFRPFRGLAHFTIRGFDSLLYVFSVRLSVFTM